MTKESLEKANAINKEIKNIDKYIKEIHSGGTHCLATDNGYIPTPCEFDDTLGWEIIKWLKRYKADLTKQLEEL